jgi:hypothetical protein
MKRTDTQTLIAAMRILARDVQCDDGIANSAIAEAADRLEELHTVVLNICEFKEGAELSFEEAYLWIQDTVEKAGY